MLGWRNKSASRNPGESLRGRKRSRPIRRSSKPARRLKEDIDKLVDEIDDVLETNAEEFVKNYVKKEENNTDSNFRIPTRSSSYGHTSIGLTKKKRLITVFLVPMKLWFKLW